MCVRCTRFTCTPQPQRLLAWRGHRPVLCCAQPPRAAERNLLQQQLQAAYDAGFQVRTARAATRQGKAPCGLEAAHTSAGAQKGYAEGAKVDIKVMLQKGGVLEAQEVAAPAAELQLVARYLC